MKNIYQSSKLLSLILRHQPEKIGLQLDGHGWALTSEMLDKLNQHGFPFDMDLLQAIVDTNNKQRFAFSDDRSKIRANQGHSIEVDLQLAPQAPPETLFHGTASHRLEAIRKIGLQKAKRHHVHLSANMETAVAVGQRHGTPIVLTVLAGEMHRAGHLFYLSANGVWLTEEVPTDFIRFPL